MTTAQQVRVLVEMGLTELEARIYLQLLQHSPSTAYATAKAIGATNGSTYKAMESLEAKGAVVVDEGENRLCRAVPSGEFLDHLESSFVDRRDRAELALSNLRGSASDEGIYQLKTVSQVYAKCRALLSSCRHLAIIDSFPLPVEELRADLEEAAATRVEVRLRVYEDVEIKGVHVVLHEKSVELTEAAPVQKISLVVDGSQYLVALLDREAERVHQAVWSASPFLSWTYLASAESEIRSSTFAHMIQEAASLQDLRDRQAQLEGIGRLTATPGYKVFRRLVEGEL